MTDSATLQLVDGQPVVTEAPERIAMAHELYKTATEMTRIEHMGRVYVTFGTRGQGVGRVTYQVIDWGRDATDTAMERPITLERIA